MNPWLWFWSQSGVLLVQLLRLSSVHMLSLSHAPLPEHKLPVISRQHVQNGNFFFHYNPWNVRRRTLPYGKSLTLDSLPNIRNVLLNKGVGLGFSELHRKRKTDTWIPAAQVRRGLQYALHPDILHSVIPFHSKTEDVRDVAAREASQTDDAMTRQKTSRATETSAKHDDRSEMTVSGFRNIPSPPQISVHKTKITQPFQKEIPTHTNDANMFGGLGFEGFQSVASVPVQHNDDPFGGFLGLEGPQFLDRSEETLPNDDIWINAGSGQISDGFGSVQVFEGQFADESRDCDVIDEKSCEGDKDCLCFGLYECSANQCVMLSVSPSQSDSGSSLGGFWHEGPVDISKRTQTSKASKMN